VDKIDLRFRNLERIDRWIEHSDSKISVLLAFQGIALGWAIDRILPVMFHVPPGISPAFGFQLLTAVFWGTAFWSVYQAFSALIPRVALPKGITDSSMFFGNISRRTLEEYRREVDGFDMDSWAHAIADQVWINSKIAQQKFGAVRRSLISFAASLAILTAILFWLKAISQ
jgi:hypothetical protein